MSMQEQTAVLKRIAASHPLREVLSDLVRMIERHANDGLCSIVFVDGEAGTIRCEVAPSLPVEYTSQLNGLRIGPTAGSCGTAAYRRERVIVEDIASHPYWDAYRHLALAFGLKACWSSPILSVEQEVLGVFAVYYREPRAPTAVEIASVDDATHLAAIAISSDRASQSLHRSEQRLRAVIEHTPDVAIQQYDEAGCLIFYNEASRKLFGWNENQALGKTLLELGFWSESEQRRFADKCAQAAQGCRVTPTQFSFRRPDGSEGFLVSTVFRIPLGDGEHGYVCMDVDLTENRRMEAVVRAGEAMRARIYDLVTDLVFYLAVEGQERYRVQSVNRALLELTGLAEEDVVGRLLDQVIPATALLRTKSKCHEAILSGRTVVWEEESEHPSGFRYAEVKISPIVDAAGGCTHLVGTVRDVTARRQAELERRQLAAQLHQAQRLQALGTLAGGIAHDVNNVLTAILCNLDLALTRLGAEEEPGLSVLEARQAAQRAASIVRQVLTFGRKSEPRLEPIELASLVEEALKLVRMTAGQKIRFGTSSANDVPRICGDSTQIHRVLLNLVTNAAHAIGDRDGCVEVRLQRQVVGVAARPDAPELAEGVYTCLTISDDGCGMDEQTLRRVFEPFFTTKPLGEGTGLGLAVVHGIMKSHGGAISVRSELGKGSMFELLFPAADEQAATVATEACPKQEPAGGRRVLFVDDDEAIVFLARRAFSRLGYRITAHSNSMEALSEFRNHPTDFDLVITDVAMPQLDGLALIRELRQIRPDARIVLT